MKILTSLAAIGLASFGFASSAAAYRFSPTDVHFTASDSTGLSTPNASNVTCRLKLRGGVGHKGKEFKVKSAVFKGSDARCATITASNLPWKAQPINATTAKLLGVALISPFGNCGDATSNMLVGMGGGSLSIDTFLNPGSCTFRATLSTTPALSIVP